MSIVVRNNYKNHKISHLLLIGILFLLFFLLACKKTEQFPANQSLTLNDIYKLQVLHKKMEEPQAGEWLSSQKENGQSFKEYIGSSPICPYKEMDKIYILPFGNFDLEDRIAISRTKDFVEAFYGLDVIIKDQKPDTIVPPHSRRMHGTEQIHTKFVLNNVLMYSIPKDAIVYTAITSKDLYPHDDWNFVFGQAYLKHRVGVSSLFRYKHHENKNLYERRLMKTVAHELGHMFSLRHCKDYKCIMNGSMSLPEADTKPIWLCPECLAKVCWCTRYDLKERYKNLEDFCRKNDMKDELLFYQKSNDILFKN